MLHTVWHIEDKYHIILKTEYNTVQVEDRLFVVTLAMN